MFQLLTHDQIDPACNAVPELTQELLDVTGYDWVELAYNLRRNNGKLAVVRVGSKYGDRIALMMLLQKKAVHDYHSLYVTGLVGELAGYLDETHRVLNEIREQWKCRDITLHGRAGFTKTLAKLGYRTSSVTMTFSPPADVS